MHKKNKIDFKQSAVKSFGTLVGSFPIMFGILLLVSLVNVFGKDFYAQLFSGDLLSDSLTGAIAGSLSFGIPITSYIVGGELLKEGVSLTAITAFIMTWTTVGVVMLPLEAKYLGKKFALVRNLTNFVFSIIIAVLTVATLNLL